MSSILQAYDALPSETASTNPTLCQSENQLSCGKARSSTELPTSDLLSRTCASWFWTNWKWEFAACSLVLAEPFIIFGTLFSQSGQPLPQWPFKVSINTLLSVYALVMKVTIGFILTSCIGQLQWTWFSETRPLTDMLRFDSATRGADGALSLIWRQRFRHPLTALGCIIMVLTVAVDPFVQQLVHPVDCSVELLDDNAAATLPRTNVFEDHYSANSSTTGDTQDRENLVKVIESVLYDAVFTPGRDPPWQCSTGNCTFQDTYGTIGICYNCQDVSADVIVNATCSHPNSSYASQHPTSGLDCPADSSFAIESNVTVGEYMKLGTKTNISRGSPDTVVVADAYAVEGTRQYSEIDGRHLIFGFLIGPIANLDGRIDWSTSDRNISGITTPDTSTCNSDDSKKSWACQGYGAATCSLEPCVQTYNATISAGVLEEHLVSSSYGTAWGTIYEPDGWGSYFALIDTHCSAQIQTPSSQDSSVENRWLPYNFSLTEADVERDSDRYSEIISFRLPDDAMSLLDNGCLYLVSASSIMSSVEQYLSGAVQGDGMTMLQFGPTGPSAIADIMRFQGPEFVRGIYNWGHTDFARVQSVIANISDSLTTYIRTHGGSPRVPGSSKSSRNVQGKLYHSATCLKVQWPWMSYSASLAVLNFSFFLMVVEVTRRQGTPVWKASPLAWVLRARGPGNGIISSSHATCKRMEEISTQVAVHLFDGDLDGPRIRMTDLKDPNLL